MSIIKLNHADFYYEVHGKGHPLVMIPGYGAHRMLFDKIKETLAHVFQVIILENRASGETKDDGRALSIDLMADDVYELICALDLKKPHVFGHSMGGTIVQALAARHSNHLSKCVIANSAPRWSQQMLWTFKTFIRCQEVQLEDETLLDLFFPWLFSNETLNDPSKVKKLKKDFMTDPYPASIEDTKRQFHALETFDAKNFPLEAIKNPTLIIISEQDIVSLPSQGYELAHLISNSYVTLVNAGHSLPREYPEKTTELLLNFLQ